MEIMAVALRPARQCRYNNSSQDNSANLLAIPSNDVDTFKPPPRSRLKDVAHLAAFVDIFYYLDLHG